MQLLGGIVVGLTGWLSAAGRGGGVGGSLVSSTRRGEAWEAAGVGLVGRGAIVAYSCTPTRWLGGSPTAWVSLVPLAWAEARQLKHPSASCWVIALIVSVAVSPAALTRADWSVLPWRLLPELEARRWEETPFAGYVDHSTDDDQDHQVVGVKDVVS